MRNVITVILSMHVLLLIGGMLIVPCCLHAQTNGGFESGLDGWITTGYVSLDSTNAMEGNHCAKMGARSSLLMQMPVTPFSVMQFECFVRNSATSVKAHSVLRFYDDAEHELLEYKSDALTGTGYQQTGNYTEAPPLSTHLTLGIVTDSSGVDDVFVDRFTVTLNIGAASEAHLPMVDLDACMRPFWTSDTVYNETVLLVKSKGQPASGKLMYLPGRILAVKNFALDTTYLAGKDFRIQGNRIIRQPASSMPFREDSSFDTKNNLAWYNLQSQWVVVSYTHKDKWRGAVPANKTAQLPEVMAKLRTGSPLTVLAYGMSITRGMDVSSYDTVKPYMPSYARLFVEGLKKQFADDRITLYNAGLPGALVSWGAMYASQYICPANPDLVIIDFGMNDFWRYQPAEFKTYVEEIIRKVRLGTPSASFILLSNIKFDPDYVLSSDPNRSFYLNNMIGYNTVLKQLEASGIVNLDMTTLSDAIYKLKKAKDCLVNPLHPNDYMARWYAQALVALFRP